MTEWVTPQRLTSGVPVMPAWQAWREGDLWVIDVPGYGITQSESEADCARMAADLVEQTRAAKIARFDAAPDAEESLRERVADAMHQAVCDCGDSNHGIYFWAADLTKAADAAIAVIRGDDA